MTDSNNTVSLTIRVDSGGADSALEQTASSAKSTQEAIDKASQQTEHLEGSVNRVKNTADGISSAKVDELNNKLKETTLNAKLLNAAGSIAVVQGLQSALSQSVGAMTTLGIVSDGTAQTLMKVSAGMQLITSAYTGIKALSAITAALNAQEAVHNALLAMKSVLTNPANLGRVALATGAAAAVAGVAGGYLIASANSGSSSTTVNNSINVSDGGNGGASTVGASTVGATVYNILDGSAI